MDLDGKMMVEWWLIVEEKILDAIAKFVDDGGDEHVSFDDARWQKVDKVVGCSNRKSKDFLKAELNDCSEL